MNPIGESWPALPLDEWLPTFETLQRWTQIVGKTRLGLAPFENHWWHCTLYVSARGLTTGVMPAAGTTVDIEIDFLDHRLVARSSDGRVESFALHGHSVATFYSEYRALLDRLGVGVRLVPVPNELSDTTPFSKDTRHATYDGAAARRCWHALTDASRVMKAFRSRFAGKCSPVHLFWGAFDLACTRFSGRRAPMYPGTVPNCPTYVMREAYSHECISAGWWPGSAGSPVPYPAFYAYAYPVPTGCNTAAIGPADAFYQEQMGEWILPYDAVRASTDPDAMVLEFLQSTYEAAAALAKWDAEALRASRLAGGRDPA